jgi:hypothetical protein
MSKFILAAIGLLMSASLHATPAETQNCVNPGGGCDGSVPCCDSDVNACVRGRCTPVPRFAPILLSTAERSEVMCYDPCADAIKTYSGNGCSRSYNTDLQCEEGTGIF